MHVIMLPCVPIKMQGVGLLDFTLGSSTNRVPYFPISYPTLPPFDIQLVKPYNV